VALEALTQKFLDRIFLSFQWVPAEFLKLCNTICVEAAKKFEKSEDLAVAGFIFLRFLCTCHFTNNLRLLALGLT